MNPRRLALVLLLLLAAPSVRAGPPCRVAHLHLGDYPALARTPWAEEAQGISHDARHWFFSTRARLFKVPAAVDLAGDLDGSRGVLVVDMPPTLASRGFDHFGDLTFHDHGGTGLLCVPVEGGPSAVLAFFRASDLHYLSSAPVPGWRSAPFCAVDGLGHVVVGRALDPDLGRFRVDWARVAAQRPFLLQPVTPLRMTDERGRPVALRHLQGAAFSEGGRLLHVSAGFWDDHACPPWTRAYWTGSCGADAGGGIHVFDVGGTGCGPEETCAALRVDRSANPAPGDARPPFAYAYRGTLLEGEEPEGITVWDLEAPGAPVVRGVRGQVHVLLLDNELPSRSDRVSVKHYRIEVSCTD